MPEASERAKSSEVGLAAKHFCSSTAMEPARLEYLHCFHVVPPLSSSIVFLPDRKMRTVDPKHS